MPFTHRNANASDLPRVVEIYNFAVANRECSCDRDPNTVEDKKPAFLMQDPAHRPLWVAETSDEPDHGVIGYLDFAHFMNERPDFFITADISIYLHPNHQTKGLGSYLISKAIDHAPSIGIKTLTASIISSNLASIRLFEKMGFEMWGLMPRVARLEGVEKDLVLVGKRLD